MPPKKSVTRLGAALKHDRFKGQRVRPNDMHHARHTTLEDSPCRGMQSVTQEGDLEGFLRTAELANTEFIAERVNISVVTPAMRNPFVLSPEKEKEILKQHEEHREKLVVPRRPSWDYDMSPEGLDLVEREAFLNWRRNLATLQEKYELLLTPFEKNIQVWRQLWRVIERSDLLVQIVDARNPLFFRSLDLEAYVKEVDSTKRNLLLVNKADLLTERQRLIWAEYFDEQGIPFMYFSAAKAKEAEDEAEDEDEDEHVKDVDTVTDDATLERSLVNASPQSKTHVLTAEELEQRLLEACPPLPECENRKHVAGLVGYPNVGKSSTINALVGAKKVAVGSTPGKTKHFQTILLSDHISLCDCPGLVFPNFASTQADMVCNGVLPIDQMREYTGPAALICCRIPQWCIETFYGIHIRTKLREEGGTGVPVAEELLTAYAVARGFTKSGQGNPDESKAARSILKDYVNGDLLYAHPPPTMSTEEYNMDLYDPETFGQRFRMRKLVGQARQINSNAYAEVEDTVVNMAQASTNSLTKKSGAATRGKYAVDDFTRMKMMLPHHGIIGEDGRPLTKAQIKERMVAAMTRPGKKVHKKGRK